MLPAPLPSLRRTYQIQQRPKLGARGRDWKHVRGVIGQVEAPPRGESALMQLCVVSLLPAYCPAPTHVLCSSAEALVVRGQPVPLAQYTSLEHCSQLEGLSDEDNDDVVGSGHLDISWLVEVDSHWLTYAAALQFLEAHRYVLHTFER